MIQVNGIGRLTSDPQFKALNGSGVWNFRIASKRVTRGEDTADFIDCSIWTKEDDGRMKLLRKGTLICVTGQLRIDTKNIGGQHRVFPKIVVDNRWGIDILANSTKDRDNQVPSNGNGNGTADTNTLLNTFVDNGLPCTIKGVGMSDMSDFSEEVRMTYVQDQLKGVLNLTPKKETLAAEVPF